ncbi:protein of unknown function [Rhodovastum atsumiense]|nr:protein of unknown function [Rhodovastum atsumiense]
MLRLHDRPGLRALSPKLHPPCQGRGGGRAMTRQAHGSAATLTEPEGVGFIRATRPAQEPQAFPFRWRSNPWLGVSPVDSSRTSRPSSMPA